MATHIMSDGSKIVTSNIFPPIPYRGCDWVAYVEGEEENSHMYGYGPTEAEAIDDLMRLLEENAECESDPEEYGHQAAKWDHQRDLRKNY